MYFKNLNWPKRNESAISETSIGYKTELLYWFSHKKVLHCGKLFTKYPS